MENEQKIEARLPEIVEPKKDQSAEKIEKVASSKKIGKSKIEPPTSADNLQDLLLKNIKLSETIFAQNKKIKRRLNLMLAGGYLKIVLIVVPLIFAVIYLGPLMNQLLAQYNSLLGGSGGALNLGDMLAPGKLDINSILSNISSQDAAKLQGMLKNLPK